MNHKSSLFWIKVSYPIYDLQIFFLIFLSCLFTSLMVLFTGKSLKFDEIYLFFLLLFMLLVCLRRFHLTQSHRDLFQSFLLRVLSLTFKSVIWVNFCVWYEVWLEFYSLKCRYPLVPSPSFETTVLGLFDCLGTLVEN